MAKSLVVFIILVVVPVFISGCSPVEPKSVEPDRVERDKTVPFQAEPEPKEVDPAGFEPNSVEPVKAEPDELQTVPAASFHDKCADILKEFVNDKGMVDYKGLRRKRLEQRALLQEFNKLDPAEYEFWTNEDKIAFWINAYNLQKLRVVTDNYPIQPSSRILTIFYRGTNNIRHIEGKITEYKFLVMDEEFTFATIEKRFFRSEFNDPRIFFAISSTCLSSPPLRNEPYYGHSLSEQLDEQTKRFLSSPLAFSIDREKRKVYLSALFQSSWYGKEFIKKFAIDRKFKDQPVETRAVLNFITNYISKENVTFLETGNYTIKYMTYDWTINDGS
ncbi:MAG: DUF547 domain-containing protein [Sedimentisphaerales bacterium]